MADKDFAIIRIKNSQEIVSEGDIVAVDKLSENEGDKIVIEEVLLVSKSGKVVVGKPLVSGASVEAEVIEQAKGEKVDSKIYKAKVRYRKHTGHRPLITKIKINKIKL